MKYVSLDIETTGIDPKKYQIISVSVVIEDTEKDVPVEELPSKTWYFEHEALNISPFIAGFHSKSGVFKEWSEAMLNPSIKKIESKSECVCSLEEFISEHIDDSRFNLAGKNVVGFDLKFLNKYVRGYSDFGDMFRQRVLDPAILYARLDDEKLPDLEECKRRAGFNDTEVAHTSLEDCYDVIRLIRHKLK